MKKPKITLTGAFGYSGKHISQQLLAQDYEVKTLTNSPHKPHPQKERIEVAPLSFDNPELLVKNLSDTDVLINTYWVRFNHRKFTHEQAVQNTKILFDAAREAGVQKIIHVSITNADENSELEYFRGKGLLENYLKSTGIDYSIVRPAVLFGGNDILINNMAWMIRHLPVMGVFSDGSYKLQPIHVEDFARLIIEQIPLGDNTIINAIGPETFTYIGLLKSIMEGIGVHKKILHVPPYAGYLLGKIIGLIKNDVTITREEIKGLMQNTLYVNDTPRGSIKLTGWVVENKDILGKNYANELKRRK